jgi:hypothetical protein
LTNDTGITWHFANTNSISQAYVSKSSHFHLTVKLLRSSLMPMMNFCSVST